LGVKLGGLLEAKKVAIDDLAGRQVAFDGHNILYQFLASIRGRTGEPLKDSHGRVTSHLSGLIYRNSNLIEAGVRIAYVCREGGETRGGPEVRAGVSLRHD